MRYCASTTMDKAVEVLHLFKEKEDIIVQLEQSLEIEKQNITDQWQGQLIELQNSFNSLKFQHESDLQAQETHIQELQNNIEQLKFNLELTKFKK